MARDGGDRGAGLVTLLIDGIRVAVPAGTHVIRAAETVGIEIPRFCDHPLLDPVGACRQCLVEVAGERRLLPACAIEAMPGMVVRTGASSPQVAAAQRGVMELLLVNHPLDCPVCDKGGECPLQNQAMSTGRGESRFQEPKRAFRKPVALSAQVLLDRERCVQCARCTRFADQIAGDPLIELSERGAAQRVATADGRPFDSYFSGNTVQICPVGALTSVSYRFRARPFDLVSTPGVCEHCAAGCALRVDVRRGGVVRRQAAEDPAVNEEWNCDKGRWAFHGATVGDRLDRPLVRDRTGGQVVSSWPEALRAAARGLTDAHVGAPGGAAVLTGGRLTVEDAYGYAKFARIVLRTNDVDFRARPMSAEESRFLAAYVAGRPLGPTYADVERAPVVLLVALEPEQEAPILHLRLRKAARRGGTAVVSIAPFASSGLARVPGRLLRAAPGAEPYVLADLMADILTDLPADPLADPLADLATVERRADIPPHRPGIAKPSDAAAGWGGTHAPEVARLLRLPGALILVGERLAEVPGGLTAAAELAASTGAALGWVPRRAGERGALEAGAFPTLLPGGRPVADGRARAEVAACWDVADLPATPGRDTDRILADAANGRIGALVVAGLEIEDLSHPRAALRALERVPFLLSLELRPSAVTERADVVLPVAAVAEKAGTFVNWEGRSRPFEAALPGTPVLSDLRVLDAIAAELGVHLGLPHPAAARAELAALGGWAGARPRHRPSGPTTTPPPRLPRPTSSPTLCVEAVLTTWRLLLDSGRSQDGADSLAATAPRPVARLSAATAAELGAVDGDPITVSAGEGAITLPLAVTDMPDRVVWVPANSPGSAVRSTLGVTAGAFVHIRRADPPVVIAGGGR
ncbi:NADH-quinone oxidoreductase subunit G [Thermopolyspora sp. NPDC052614]|uniref:NADH-quinone oxidoreductase subunit G n=1 Tax=Thermopolyspora sp. NPDC052614 TaxID=3155682 RepID=UPI00341C80D1